MQKILIIDNHRLFAEGIRLLIEQATDYEVVAVLNKGQETLPFLASNQPDLVILEIDLPHISGLEITKSIRVLYPQIKVLAFSMGNDFQLLRRIIGAGATGFCNKNASREELFQAIHKTINGVNYLPPDYFRQLKRPKIEFDNLSRRETEIMTLISDGNSSNEIAGRLFLSIRTVETHRKNIYRKLKIHTNVALALYARTIRAA